MKSLLLVIKVVVYDEYSLRQSIFHHVIKMVRAYITKPKHLHAFCTPSKYTNTNSHTGPDITIYPSPFLDPSSSTLHVSRVVVLSPVFVLAHIRSVEDPPWTTFQMRCS